MICFKCGGNISPKHKKMAGLHRQCYLGWFQLDNPQDFRDLVAYSTEEQDDQFKLITSSFYQGTFKKYSAMLGEKAYILKVREDNYPELPATEYLCNQLAVLMKLAVPAFYLIRFQEKIDTFVCENFLHNQFSQNLIHIYHFLENVNDYHCEALLTIIKNKTGRLQEIERFIDICLFDALIGNHDRHGRNLGLIQSPGGYVLAPFYDNPSYLALEDNALLAAQHEPRGKIATQKTIEPTMKDYVEEWARLGYRQQVIDFQKKISINAIEQCIRHSFISTERQKALKKLINNRYKELVHALDAA